MIARRAHPQALLLALLLLAAPATRVAANNCTGGGRPRPDQGGIGGTGVLPMAPDDEGGIGGTGISLDGDTGIIGTITGFASVCVGGVEVHYARDTVVEVDGQRTTTASLAVGQVVEVVAGGTGSEVLAQHISVRHLISGPVTRVDAQRNAIEVIGQTVQLSTATRAGGSDDDYSAVATVFPLNSYVQVSGMRRRDGVVMASRVTGSETHEVAQLTGAVTRLESGMIEIAGTQVRLTDRAQRSVGDEVHVIGHWDGNALVAQAVEPLPRIPFDGHVRRIDIEGYAGPSSAGQLQVGAFVVELPRSAAADALQQPGADARIRIEAVVRDRQVIVEHVFTIGDLPQLPPQPDREMRGGRGGGPGDTGHKGGPPALDQSRQDDRGAPGPMRDHNMVPAAVDVGGMGPPERADLPDRPAPPQLPDRPQRPEPPPRPERPQVPDRPPRPERPDVRGRP